MAFYTGGYEYSVPTGYQSKEGVAQLQKQLNAIGANLKVDGIWGPKTDAAYAQANGPGPQSGGYGTMQASGYANYSGGNVYGGTDLNALYQQVLGVLSPPSISYAMPSRDELTAENSGILRPAYDQAILQRQRQTLQNRAEIDVDAASRGMGRSTWVTDVKDRAMDSEADDIARMEGEYAAALSAAVQEQYEQHLANKLAADQYNAQATAAAQNAAFGYATQMYNSNLAQAQAMQAAMLAGAGGSGGGKSSGKSGHSGNLSNSVKEQMNRTALQIYDAYAKTPGALQKVMSGIATNNPYDQVYQPGASDYILGVLNGLR